MDFADLAITTALAVIGLYFTHSLRRHQRLRIAEQRLGCYRALWALMEVARPTRLEDVDEDGELTRQEGRELYRSMTHWYFGEGQGMLMTEPTKHLYLRVKGNLGAFAAGKDGDWKRVVRELSLLRTQMKLDLDMYGASYFNDLNEQDEDALRDAGIDPTGWAQPSRFRRFAARLGLSDRLRSARSHSSSDSSSHAGAPVKNRTAH